MYVYSFGLISLTFLLLNMLYSY